MSVVDPTMPIFPPGRFTLHYHTVVPGYGTSPTMTYPTMVPC